MVALFARDVPSESQKFLRVPFKKAFEKASFTAAIKLDQTLSELVHAHIMSDHTSDKETGEIPQEKGAVAL
jgi:hypothetical protein